NGRRVRVTPARGGEAALFVAQGAGSLRNARGSWPVQPGSGLYFPVGGTYTPGIATVPLYAVWFSSSRAPRIEVLKK
ncbi:hypothetical protein KJ865_16090, partial [Myxococcota bacterium]|nr:hypothetical protein [Myxococcota bacterium]